MTQALATVSAAFRFLLISLAISLLLPTKQVALPILAQQTKPTKANGKGKPGEATKLKVGKGMERELRGGEEHTYEITLKVGQYLDAVIEQRGIEVVVVVTAPDGNLATEVKSPTGGQGTEPVSLIAAATGAYRLLVRPAEQGAPAGKYEIRVAQVRTATAKDRDLQEAAGLLKEAERLYGEGKYDEAMLRAERALASREKILGANHPDFAEALNNLAMIYFLKGDYAKAEPRFQRALVIQEKALGPEHRAVAISLNNLAELYQAKGEYAKAEAFLLRSLTILEKVLSKEHVDIASALNDLGLLYTYKGDYVKAEAFHQRALAIREKVLGKEHIDVAGSLNNLAFLYQTKGDYAKAESFFQRSLTIMKKTIGAEHPDVATTMNNLAATYYLEGDYGKAEPLYQRAMAIDEKILGPNHPGVATDLNNLAVLYDNKGDYGKAEPLYQQALAIREKALGPEHPYVALSLNGLAKLYQAQADLTKAEPLYLRALEIREKAYGAEHPNVANSLNDLARFYQAKGDLAQTLAFRARANEVRERDFLRNLSSGSERQKLVYVNQYAFELDATLSLHLNLAPDNRQALQLAVTTLLQRKGRALDAMADTIAILRHRAKSEDQKLLEQLASKRSAFSVLTLKVPDKEGAEKYKADRKALEEEIEKLEATIGLRSAEFRSLQTPVTLDGVQQSIPADAALVEFAIYHPYDAKAQKKEQQLGKARYVAYLLRNQGEPQWVELGDAEAINKKVADFRRALRDPATAAIGGKASAASRGATARADVKSLARQLDQLVMASIRKRLGPTRRLFLSPDGALNLIPFAALVDEQNQYLVKDYSFTYVTSGRDLLRLQSPATQSQAALIIADPDFDDTALKDQTTAGSQTRIAQRVNPANNPSQKGVQTGVTPGPKLGDQDFQPLGRLASTAREASEIKTLLPEARLLTRREATKAVLQTVSSPAILHIATHGFFLEDEGGSAKFAKNTRLAVRISGGNGVEPGDKIANPLLRSGLFLAGANTGGDGDGVLTALEVAGLDLSGTRLVVLSACDTGVGEVLNGDGVYGLRRALVLAGSEAQMISLWSVSDVGTSELMIEYYKALQAGAGRSEALREVQLKMLKNPKRQHPYFWAAFIQSGEWANLDGKR